MQKPLAEKVKQRGYQLILTDPSEFPFCGSVADKIVKLDTHDLKGNLDASESIAEAYDVRAVITASSDACEGPALLAQKLGLSGVDPAIAHICRQKHLTRAVLKQAGIPQPDIRLAQTFEEAKQIVQEIKLPVCFKATDSSASRGFSALRVATDVSEKAFNDAKSNGSTGSIIIETLLEPIETEIAEQSLETLWYNGKMYWLNWVDRIFRKDIFSYDDLAIYQSADLSWGIEVGHLNPALHPNQTLDAVREMVYSAGVALGLHLQKGGHIMKCDTMLTKQGPVILEVTLRLSGGWDSGGSSLLRGADFIGGAIEMALGRELTLDLYYKYFTFKYPALHAAVLTKIPSDSKDCMGRMFSIGAGNSRQHAIANAKERLEAGFFV